MNNNMKRFVGYLIYVIAIGYFSLEANYYHQHLIQLITAQGYGLIYLFIFQSIFPIIFGLFLVLPQFITRFQKKGSWVFDWIMFLPVGLPSLFIVVLPVITWVLESLIRFDIVYFFLHQPQLVTLSGILFGYILLNSFNKKEK